MAYSGKYRPLNEEKYSGDSQDIVYRSLWEKGLMKWLDTNPDVKSWASETTVIPYKCKTDGKAHRYFLDFTVTFKNDAVLLIEVKPNAQTKPPKLPKSGRKTKRYIVSCLTYAKNISKWDAAAKYAKSIGATFQIWDEFTLQQLGIRTKA